MRLLPLRPRAQCSMIKLREYPLDVRVSMRQLCGPIRSQGGAVVVRGPSLSDDQGKLTQEEKRGGRKVAKGSLEGRPGLCGLPGKQLVGLRPFGRAGENNRQRGSGYRRCRLPARHGDLHGLWEHVVLQRRVNEDSRKRSRTRKRRFRWRKIVLRAPAPGSILSQIESTKSVCRNQAKFSVMTFPMKNFRCFLI